MSDLDEMTKRNHHPKFDVKVSNSEGAFTKLEEGLIELAITRNGQQWYSIDLYPAEMAQVARAILDHLIAEKMIGAATDD